MIPELHGLNPVAFQQLAAALATRALGAKAQAFGRGPDGGRDFTFDGVLTWSGDEGPVDVWDGHTVFQVKKKDRLADEPRRDAAWLAGQINDELDAWANPEGSRGRAPDYLVFVTNVPLTAVPSGGGFDTVHASVKRRLSELKNPDLADPSESPRSKRGKRDRAAQIRPLRGWRIWDGNQIEQLLTAYPEVRRGFPGMLTAGDVLAQIRDITGITASDEVEGALRRHAMARLIEDRFVYFDEAGTDPSEKTALHDVVVDLPIAEHRSAGTAHPAMILKHVIEHGDRCLSPESPLVPSRRHIVLAAGPGNGKSTISKFLAQIYRASLLDGAQVSAAHSVVIQGVRDALTRLNCPMPTNRRWPLRIDLAEYSEHFTSEGESSLLRWIAGKVNRSAIAGVIMPHHLASWLRQWPWLLILDGLDEVTVVAARRRLIQEIESFVAEADVVGADLLVVVTTRPTGYSEEIDPGDFVRVDLARFSAPEALAYGRLVAGVRLKGETSRRERLLQRLEAATADDSLRHLMQTPLQVLILTLVLESSGTLPTSRFGLFDLYYTAVYRREVSKGLGVSSLLQRHQPHIDELHERVGFELQCQSEAGDGAMAAMSIPDLRELVRQGLRGHGFEVDGNDGHVVDEIMDAATLRLVLLAPRTDGGVGFDVRSLQELMAARHLTARSDQLALDALRIAAASPHWRNTWIFAAGRAFALRNEALQQSIVTLVEGVDTGAPQRLSRLVPVGPGLALDLLDDGLARSYPTLEERILRTAMQVLADPLPPDALGVARALIRTADGSPRLRHVIANALREGLAGRAGLAATTQAVQGSISTAVAELGANAELLGLGQVKVVGVTATSSAPDREDADVLVDSLVDDPATRDALHAAVLEIRRLLGNRHLEAGEPIYAVLQNADLASALELTFETERDATTILCIRDRVLPAVWRAPVGPQLRQALS